MFLNSLTKRNPEFIEAVVKLHAEGKLEANTYVIDIESVKANVSVLSNTAKQSGLHVYGMTKQIGYNPIIQQAIVDRGIETFVAVDWMGARQMSRQGFKIGHVGHLVQPPLSAMNELLKMYPEVFTIFSFEKALSLNNAAKKLDVKQDILLRVYGENPRFYPGHEGGFFVDDLVDAAREIAKLPNLRIVGVTSFPCLLFNEDAQDVIPTQNFKAVIKAAYLLRKELNLEVTQVNVPGTTTSSVMEMVAKHGGTHVEPGHGLTGTTPLATVYDVPEKPAILYLSEISHVYNGRAHMLGGGLYVDPVRGRYDINVLVGRSLDRRQAELIPDDGIDYYGYINGGVIEGDPVIMGFRPQVFVTRGQVAVIDGIEQKKPKVLGYFDSQGNPIIRGQ